MRKHARSQEVDAFESLLDFRFRRTTLKHKELFIAFENIIIENDLTVPIKRQKKFDTSAPLSIGMATKDDREGSRRRRPVNHGRHAASCRQRTHAGTHRGTQVATVAKGAKRGRMSSRQKGNDQKGVNGPGEGCKGDSTTFFTCPTTSHIKALCPRGGNKNLNAIDEVENGINEEALDNEELQAWCLF